MRIGLFGGSFNPVHAGHLIASRAVAERLRLDHLWLIPAAAPPHRVPKNLAVPYHRLEMLRRAIRGEPLFGVSDLELDRPGPSYTVTTVEDFQRRLGPQAELFWIIGADSLADLANWFDAPRLVDLCRIITAARPGWDRPDWATMARRFNAEQIDRLKADVLETPRIDISASEVRRRVAAGLSIRYLVPDAVSEYIAAHGLYQPA